MKESLGGYYIHKRIAIFMAFIMVLTMLPMHTQQVYAKSNEAKILIWSPYILQTEVKKLYAPGLEEFISKDEVAGYAGVDKISVDLIEGAQDNPLHFTGTEDLSQYGLIIVMLPYESLTDTDVSVLKNYLNAGGRIVLQGERDGFARYENKVLSDFAGQLGVTFQITINDDDQDNAIINKDSDIMGGQDLVGNELEYRAIGEITYSGDAQVIATSVDKKYPFIVDFPVQKGRITVMSDVNWWHRRSNMLHTPAQLQSAQELWGKFLSNSIKNMEAVKNGINPNHEHHFNYISQGNKILAYCDETWGASGCEYNGISNAVAVNLLADDAFYSGEAYSGITVEGIDTYNAITKSNLDKSQVSFYQVEIKGTTSGGIKLESAPKEKGHYYAAITSNGAQAVAAFSIEGLAYSITIQNGTTEIADSKATEDTIVTIKADPAPAGKVFDKWVVESGSITLADANSATTTFTMPASAVSVKATYTDASLECLHKGRKEIRDAKAASCTKEGYTGDTYCLVCKAKISTGTVIAKSAHIDKDKDHLCDVCGATVSEHSLENNPAKEKTVLRLQAIASRTAIKMKWNAVPEADGYVIYWNKCGAKNAFKPIKIIKSGKTLTWTHTKLKKNSLNKYYIKAYKVIGGKRCFIKTSRVIHLATKGGKYTNVKKLKANISSVTLKKGKTKTLKITQTYAEKNKKLLLHMRPLTYTTSNKIVATVTAKGVIKAKGTGSCYIYVTAYSGVYTRVKVTVK